MGGVGIYWLSAEFLNWLSAEYLNPDQRPENCTMPEAPKATATLGSE